jgi:hypothetical protein
VHLIGYFHNYITMHGFMNVKSPHCIQPDGIFIEMIWNNKLIYIVHLVGYFHSCITMHGFVTSSFPLFSSLFFSLFTSVLNLIFSLHSSYPYSSSSHYCLSHLSPSATSFSVLILHFFSFIFNPLSPVSFPFSTASAKFFIP